MPESTSNPPSYIDPLLDGKQLPVLLCVVEGLCGITLLAGPRSFQPSGCSMVPCDSSVGQFVIDVCRHRTDAYERSDVQEWHVNKLATISAQEN